MTIIDKAPSMIKQSRKTVEAQQACFISPELWERLKPICPNPMLLHQEGQLSTPKTKDLTLVILSTTSLPQNKSELNKIISQVSSEHIGFLALTNDIEQIERVRSLFESSKLFCDYLPLDLELHYIEATIHNLFTRIEIEKQNIDLHKKVASDKNDLQRILHISRALSTEKNFEVFITLIIEQVRRIVCADGGSIYVVENHPASEKPKFLRFKRSALMLNSDEFLLPIDANSIAGYVALTGKPLIIHNVRKLPRTLPFSFNEEVDRKYNYYTKSMLVLPMINQLGNPMGVLQLINRKRSFNEKLDIDSMQGNGVISFTHRDYRLASAIANQSAIALYNQQLLEGQRNLLESFIKLIATAIDSKSDYTGGHCRRVPALTEMLAQAACECKEGNLADFDLPEEGWYELRIAAGLHDCGKIVTPVHVMDKATKLETIFDRIEIIKLRFELLRQNAKQEHLKNLSSKDTTLIAKSEASLQKRLEEINDMQEFIKHVNIGGEFLSKDKINRIIEISKECYTRNDKTYPLLTDEEVKNLSVDRGTLTQEERLIINSHMVETIKMLEALPFPENLQRVPEYAAGHHEKMNGDGYPRGIFGQDMSIPARIMAVADVFEALTATDRPYKKQKTLCEAMEIMGKMKENNHLDPEVFDLFVKSKVYMDYAKKFMPPELISDIDEEKLLKIQPSDFILPPEEERKKRWDGFLTTYQKFA